MRRREIGGAAGEYANVDPSITAGFGDEWSRLDQSRIPRVTLEEMFWSYFRLFPWMRLPAGAIGADFGCGSGRWAALVAPRVGRLFCIDASDQALDVARRNLQDFANCEFVPASVANIPIPDSSLDFGYSLGVLHHIPDTQKGLACCVAKLKAGAPFLLYLYYRFDNRPAWYRALWAVTNTARLVISRFPYALRYWTCQTIAAAFYWPAARTAHCARKLGIDTRTFPLQFYADKPFYVMRTDALDRFGTRLERRFTRSEVEVLMRSAGLDHIQFNDDPPFWCALGYRA